MILETNVYKSILTEDYNKSAHLLSEFLKSVYNRLSAGKENKVNLSKFTSLTDAIFFMLFEKQNRRYQTWNDYKKDLDAALLDTNFPKLIARDVKRIKQYCLTSPIVAPHSNELTAIEIIQKLLKICHFDDLPKENDDDQQMDVTEYENSDKVLLTSVEKSLDQPLKDFGAKTTGDNILDDVNLLATRVIETKSLLTLSMSLFSLEFVNIPVNLKQLYDGLLKVLIYLGTPDFNSFLNEFGRFIQDEPSSTVLGVIENSRAQIDICRKEVVALLPFKNDYYAIVKGDAYLAGKKAIQVLVEAEIEIKTSNADNVLNTYARYYTARLMSNVYSEQESNRLVTDERYFFMEITQYSKRAEQLKSESGKYEELQAGLMLMAGSNSIEIVFSLLKQIMTSVVGDENSTFEATYVKIDQLCSLTYKRSVVEIISLVDDILYMFREDNRLSDVPGILKSLLELFPADSVQDCIEYITNLLFVAGKTKTHDVSFNQVTESLVKVKHVYETLMSDETFTIENLASDINRFISWNNPEGYGKLEGSTNCDKLSKVYDGLITPLYEIYPTLDYTVFLNFLNNLVDTSDQSVLEQDLFDATILKLEKYAEVNDELTACQADLDTNGSKIEALEEMLKASKDMEISLNAKLSILEKDVENLNLKIVDLTKTNTESVRDYISLKDQYDALLESHKECRKVATIRPFKRIKRKLPEIEQYEREQVTGRPKKLKEDD